MQAEAGRLGDGDWRLRMASRQGRRAGLRERPAGAARRAGGATRPGRDVPAGRPDAPPATPAPAPRSMPAGRRPSARERLRRSVRHPRDELLEGGRSSVFVKVGGRWLMPLLSADILPGGCAPWCSKRSTYLDRRPDRTGRCHALDGARHAEAIVIANGLLRTMRARLRWARKRRRQPPTDAACASSRPSPSFHLTTPGRLIAPGRRRPSPPAPFRRQFLDQRNRPARARGRRGWRSVRRQFRPVRLRQRHALITGQLFRRRPCT